MVKFLIECDDFHLRDLIGGKGSQLQQLHLWGAKVAPFKIIPTTFFEFYQKQEILPQGFINEVNDFIRTHGKIALRSSMVGEDHTDSSFAGLFETILNLDLDNWQDALFRIYASLSSKRVREYIQQKNIKTSLKMAVVVQKEISTTKSGVIFTRNPIPPTSLLAIDAAFGMGEGIVSGHVEVDHLLINRMGQVQFREGKVVLNDGEILQIYKESLRLEKKMSYPADIEWGFKDGELFIFQIRPITRTFSPLGIFADTNLSESYPGTVSPLSARFVQKAYENVFMESAEHLGMRQERREKIRVHTQNLISQIDSHLYYNLEHYYAALRASPGGDKNIQNWHKMIGGKIEGFEVPYHDTRAGFWDNFLSAFNFFRIALLRNTIFPSLMESFELRAKSIKLESINQSNSTETIKFLNKILGEKMNFGLTIINDFFIMIGLDIVGRALVKKGLGLNELVDLLKTKKNIDSVKPLEAFQTLMRSLPDQFIDEFVSLKVRTNFDPYQEIFSKLEEKGFLLEVEELQDFISEYGDRSFEELKLESLPIKNDPLILQQLMQWSRQQLVNTNLLGSQNKKQAHIQFSFVEKWILNFTRECIEYRESSRLWRGRFYHLYRELIIQLAFQLKKEDTTFEEFELRDFFSLNHEEWLAFADGNLSQKDVQKFMKIRDWKNKKITYPEFLIAVENEPLPHAYQTAMTSSDKLLGQGVSPGVTQGVALVLESPQEIFEQNIKNFILVTKNTDPAWVYIMSKSQGLISEKGSLLSHTAIIGRELGIPTVVGVKDATRILKTGDQLQINGTTGEINYL